MEYNRSFSLKSYHSGQSEQSHNFIKCVIAGDNGVGKRELVKTLLRKNNASKSENDGKSVSLNDIRVVKNEEAYVMSFFNIDERNDFNEANVCILCYSIVSSSSFQNIENKWVPEIQKQFPGRPIILVGTKSDLRVEAEDNCIQQSQVNGKAIELNCISHLECSALKQEGLESLLQNIITAYLNSYQSNSSKTCPMKINCIII